MHQSRMPNLQSNRLNPAIPKQAKFVEDLPNTAVDVFIKISEDLVLEYTLDMFQRWRLYPILMVDGFPFRGLSFAIGVASDEWMEDYFNDERFEHLYRFA
jgi:hypothetical protein